VDKVRGQGAWAKRMALTAFASIGAASGVPDPHLTAVCAMPARLFESPAMAGIKSCPTLILSASMVSDTSAMASLMEIWFPILWVGIGYMLFCRNGKKKAR
jgi:hypothetical protein